MSPKSAQVDVASLDTLQLMVLVCVFVCLKKAGKLTKVAEKPETPKNTSTSAASITDSINNLKLDDATKSRSFDVPALQIL